MSNVTENKTIRYIVCGATIMCSGGTGTSSLNLPQSHNFEINGKSALNISDSASIVNIGSMGQCKLKDKLPPCVPSTNTDWQQGKNNVLIDGAPALLMSSFIVCGCGGVINIVFDGQ